jgi:hypothetical protein
VKLIGTDSLRNTWRGCRYKTARSYSVNLQSLKDLGYLTYGRILKLFRHLVRLLGWVISPSQGLYLHRTTQHRKMRTNIHVLSGIQTHDPSVRAIKADTPDHAATVTSIACSCSFKLVTKHMNMYLVFVLCAGSSIRYTLFLDVMGDLGTPSIDGIWRAE